MDLDEAVFAFGLLVVILIVSGNLGVNMQAGLAWANALMNRAVGNTGFSFGVLVLAAVGIFVLVEVTKK